MPRSSMGRSIPRTICATALSSASLERNWAEMVSSPKKVVSTTSPMAFASRGLFFGMAPGVKGSVRPNTLISFLGRKSIFTAM